MSTIGIADPLKLSERPAVLWPPCWPVQSHRWLLLHTRPRPNISKGAMLPAAIVCLSPCCSVCLGIFFRFLPLHISPHTLFPGVNTASISPRKSARTPPGSAKYFLLPQWFQTGNISILTIIILLAGSWALRGHRLSFIDLTISQTEKGAYYVVDI